MSKLWKKHWKRLLVFWASILGFFAILFLSANGFPWLLWAIGVAVIIVIVVGISAIVLIDTDEDPGLL